MANIDMKTLTIGENTYIIVDAGARTLIGDLTDLDTTAKNNLVAAINELLQGGGGSSVEPYTSNPADLGNSASPGSSNKFSRGDHVHKKPTPAEIGAGTYSLPEGGTTGQFLQKTSSGTQWATPSGSSVSPYDLIPQMDGTASAGSSLGYSRGDHRHPSDTTKADAWAYEEVDDDGAVTQALSKNTYYDFTSSSLTSLTLTLDDEDTDHYHFMFYAPTAITVTMPSGVVMPSGFQIEADTWYEIDILRGLGVVQSWPGT